MTKSHKICLQIVVYGCNGIVVNSPIILVIPYLFSAIKVMDSNPTFSFSKPIACAKL